MGGFTYRLWGNFIFPENFWENFGLFWNWVFPPSIKIQKWFFWGGQVFLGEIFWGFKAPGLPPCCKNTRFPCLMGKGFFVAGPRAKKKYGLEMDKNRRRSFPGEIRLGPPLPQFHLAGFLGPPFLGLVPPCPGDPGPGGDCFFLV